MVNYDLPDDGRAVPRVQARRRVRFHFAIVDFNGIGYSYAVRTTAEVLSFKLFQSIDPAAQRH